MSAFVVGIDSWLATANGPLLARDLQPGDVVILRAGDGRLRGAAIGTVTSNRSGLWQLYTELGDLLLRGDATVITRAGHQSVEDVAAEAIGDTRPRLEMLAPSDLAPPRPGRLSPRRALQAALGALDPPVILLPRADDEAAAVKAAEAILAEANVLGRRHDSDRWTALSFDRPAPDKPAGRAHLGRQGEALLHLLAWSNGSARTRVDATHARQRLLAGLVATPTPFVARWLPAYRPVECHIMRTTDGSWLPFVPVLGAAQITGEVAVLDVDQPGHLVVGLALVGAARFSR